MPHLITSRASDMWRRLTGRYSLAVADEYASMAVSSIIVPVTDADDVMASYTGLIATVSITNTFATTIFTVPVGHRYLVYTHYLDKSTGTWTMDSLQILPSGGSTGIIFDKFVGSTQETSQYPQLLPMNQGDQMQINLENVSVAGNLSARFWIRDVDMRTEPKDA